MALVVYDRVQETTATTGTGSITLLGAVAGFQSFDVVGNGNQTFYCIVNESAWEVGIGTYSTTGPTLARTTVLSNSDGNTSPITLVGASSVFCTYPAEKSVNLDDSGNVSPLGTITSGVWNGTTIPVAYGGTGVTSSSGANSVVLRDSNANVTFNNFISGASATTASGTTTVLTASSARTQILVGSTNQTFQLPNATTMSLGQSFIFVNNSTGTLTVKDNASTTVETVPSGGVTQLGAVSVATSAGTWGAYSFIPAAVDWGTNALNLASTVISGGTWQGGTIGTAYGGTGLTTFTAANYALYSSSSSTLTAGTLPIAAGGTGATSFSANYIPYVNGTNTAFTSSASFKFNGSYLEVGGTTPLSGATNPIVSFSSTADNYVQTYVYNASSGTSASADLVAYADNSADTHGWADIGYTSSTYNDPIYTITGPNEAYILGSAPSGAGKTGNLVYATDNTGSENAHQWYVGGFTQAKSAWKMQLTSTGLQLANALSASYGGTGATSAQGGMNALAGAVTSGSYLRGNGTNVVMSTIQAADVPTLNQNTTGSAGSVANAVTFNDGGSGAASGTSFNGSAARTISYNTIGAQPAGTYVTSVSATSPVASSGGTTPTISMPAATTSASGYLTSTDWNTFNGKLSTAVTSATAGTGISVSASTGAVTFTNTGVTSAVAGTGVSVSGGTGAVTFSIGQAIGTGDNVQHNSLGIGTAASGTAGEIRATNNITAYYSDERLKTKIGSIENALDKVKQIETMVYHANETAVGLGYDASIIEVGVTAQSVQKVMPQTVAPAPIDDNYLTVRYERLVPLLIEAIKELEAQVAELKAK